MSEKYDMIQNERGAYIEVSAVGDARAEERAKWEGEIASACNVIELLAPRRPCCHPVQLGAFGEKRCGACPECRADAFLSQYATPKDGE